MLAVFSLASCDRHDDNTTVIHDTVYITLGTETPTSGFDQYGASKSTFSVGEGVSVRFSRGNLQYQASTGTWRFAEHQYDYIGNANANISSTYSGWIDLFGWGTSGWNSGASCYQPWATGTSSSYYYPGGIYTNSLTGDYAKADWGVYNAIFNGGNSAGMWRVLTKDEFEYLMFNRSSSSLGGTPDARFAKATVSGNEGLIIFPDNFTMPSSLNMVSSINSIDVSYDVNVYNSNQWEQMEANGAVFLPAAGIRGSEGMWGCGMEGGYWTSTYGESSYDGPGAYLLYFMGTGVYTPDVCIRNYARFDGRSVRLVKA